MGVADREDGELLRRVAAGDAAAMTPLMARWQPRVYGLCLNVLSSHADAADAAQQCWIQVWKYAARFDADRSFPAWVAKIAINAARMVARKRGGEVSLQAGLGEEAAVPDSPAAGSFEAAEDLQSLLKHLEPREQTVLYMKHGLGFSYLEIEEATGIGRNYISVLLCRARQKLRELHPQRNQ